MLIDEESARESAVTLLTVLESPAIDSAAIESKPVFTRRGSVESHKKRLFLLRAPLPVGFGKLFCSNSDKVLKVADDLLFTAKESRARSAAVSSYDLKHLTFVVRTYSPSAGNTQFA
ncbi:hypothetical protein V6N13_048109 [Hibiscus sabdariffa]